MGNPNLTKEQQFIVATFACLVRKDAEVSIPALKELFTYYTNALTNLSGYSLEQIKQTTFYCIGQMDAYAATLDGDAGQDKARDIALSAVAQTNTLLALEVVEQTLEAEMLASVSTKH